MGELYDADVLEWSERQAALLRRHAVGQLGNETPDWANIIEEVESVGRSQLSAVKSLLAQALAHDLKCEALAAGALRAALARGGSWLPGRRGGGFHAVHAPADRRGGPIPPGAGPPV